MMKLYFLRHGIADWPNWKDDDDRRPLTPDGIEKMKAEAKAIKRLKPELDLILSSPLPRAKQTAEIVGDKLGLKVTLVPALAPGFSSPKLTTLLKAHVGAESIMLVGHEPDLGGIISKLIGGGRIIMKKGGLARVDLEEADSLAGQLIWLLAPKVLAGE
jgi:phosphohistidine phosphatase